jgi:hypothetical protein
LLSTDILRGRAHFNTPKQAPSSNILKGLLEVNKVIAEEKTEGKLDNSTVFGNQTNLDISGVDLISQDIRSTINLQQDLAAGKMTSGQNAAATYLKEMREFNNQHENR